jgi:hypothetical protein
MEEQRHNVPLFTMTIKEENGKYVLTKSQLQFLINQNKFMFSLLNRLLEERRRLELLLAEHNPENFVISETKSYLN